MMMVMASKNDGGGGRSSGRTFKQSTAWQLSEEEELPRNTWKVPDFFLESVCGHADRQQRSAQRRARQSRTNQKNSNAEHASSVNSSTKNKKAERLQGNFWKRLDLDFFFDFLVIFF